MSGELTTLEANRRELIETVTQAVRQTADVVEAEQAELMHNLPAMASRASSVMLEPSVIRDFLQSDEYRQAIDDYVAGRLEVNLLVKVLELLQQVAEIKLQQAEYEQALNFAVRSYDVGPKVGEICSKNWRTISLAKERLEDTAGAREAEQRASRCMNTKPSL